MNVNLLDFKNIVLDLDNTIWRSDSGTFWAKNLDEKDIWLSGNDEFVLDSNSNGLRLDFEVYNTLKTLFYAGKRISYLSSGAKEGVPHDFQPAIRCLHEFRIFQWFNDGGSLLPRESDKSKHIYNSKDTIFIDDKEENLNQMRARNHDVFCLNRNAFKEWGLTLDCPGLIIT